MPLPAVKRARDNTPVATHSFNMVKRPRPSNGTLMGNIVRQAMSSKQSTLTSTYRPFTLLPRSKAKSRPQLQVEPPPPSLDFIGLSPITSFLSFSSQSESNLLPSGDPKGVEYDVYPRNEVPYSMLYDSVTPENELHSYELMQKLTADGSPSFLHIPTSSPVRNALDLGCGYGHWVAHAAQVWGAHGAKIIGVGIPLSFDEDQVTLPGVDSENVKLLCHNFLTEQLPFPNNSFDYVRLNDAVTTIPGECWDFVLSEIYRVLCPGGRLELIHDQLCFSAIGPETPTSCTFASSAKESHSYTNVLGATQAKLTSPPESKKSPYKVWEAEARNCNDIERLYLDMLAQRYGIHPLPRAILLDTIRRRFGDEGLLNVSNAHVCLPSREFMTQSHAGPPKPTKTKKLDFGISITIDWGPEKPSKTIGKPPAAAAPQISTECLSLTSLPPFLNKKAASLMGVEQLSPAGARYQPPGVVVVHTSSEGTRYPMTYLPMSPTQLDMHSNKHVHSVISAKLALEAHIDELDEKGKPSMSHEALDEALWQYAMFRRKRFNWPEIDPFEWESGFEGNGESDEQMPPCTLPDTQTTDGLTPVRLFEIFEVIKSQW